MARRRGTRRGGGGGRGAVPSVLFLLDLVRFIYKCDDEKISGSGNSKSNRFNARLRKFFCGRWQAGAPRARFWCFQGHQQPAHNPTTHVRGAALSRRDVASAESPSSRTIDSDSVETHDLGRPHVEL